MWAKFRALRELPPEQWSRGGAQRLPAEENSWLLKVDSSLRAFFSVPSEGRFLIDDFVRQELLDRYFSGENQPAEKA